MYTSLHNIRRMQYFKLKTCHGAISADESDKLNNQMW